MGASRTVSDALARLSAAYAAAGISPPAPASEVDADIDQIKRAIAPLTLPVQLEDFWRQVDPWTLTLMPYPELVRPEKALDTWQGIFRELKMSPRLLFPVGVQGSDYLLVELEVGRGPGGACFMWSPTWGSYDLRAVSLVDHLDLAATFIESGEFERQEPYPPFFDPEERWDDAAAAALPSPRAVRGFEQDFRLVDERDNWPEHWRAADRLAFSGPREHLATVQELLLAAEDAGAALGTVRVRVLRSTESGTGRLWTVADGSGGLDGWCPAAFNDLEPGWDQVVELDLEVRRIGSTTDWDAVAAAISALVARGDLEGAAELGRTAHYGEFDTQARAEVTAVRATD